MLNNVNLLDYIHIQKYIYLFNLFTSRKIEVSIFENTFLQLRREDTFWNSGLLNKSISKLLDTFFLDIDEYTPEYLFDPNYEFNINEAELHKRTVDILNELTKMIIH